MMTRGKGFCDRIEGCPEPAAYVTEVLFYNPDGSGPIKDVFLETPEVCIEHTDGLTTAEQLIREFTWPVVRRRRGPSPDDEPPISPCAEMRLKLVLIPEHERRRA